MRDFRLTPEQARAVGEPGDRTEGLGDLAGQGA